MGRPVSKAQAVGHTLLSLLHVFSVHMSSFTLEELTKYLDTFLEEFAPQTLPEDSTAFVGDTFEWANIARDLIAQGNEDNARMILQQVFVKALFNYYRYIFCMDVYSTSYHDLEDEVEQFLTYFYPFFCHSPCVPLDSVFRYISADIYPAVFEAVECALVAKALFTGGDEYDARQFLAETFKANVNQYAL